MYRSYHSFDSIIEKSRGLYRINLYSSKICKTNYCYILVWKASHICRKGFGVARMPDSFQAFIIFDFQATCILGIFPIVEFCRHGECVQKIFSANHISNGETYFSVSCFSIESAIILQSASRYSLAASASNPAGSPR